MWNVNINLTVTQVDGTIEGFILTMWNVNPSNNAFMLSYVTCSILTMWNVNLDNGWGC